MLTPRIPKGKRGIKKDRTDTCGCSKPRPKTTTTTAARRRGNKGFTLVSSD